MNNTVILNNHHVCTLPLDKEYDFRVLKACFDPSGTKLQLMIALESVDELDHDVILEEIELNSPLFELLVSHVYPAECHEVIDFDLEDITMFSGTVRIKKDLTGKVGIMWEYVDLSEALFCSAEKYRSRRSVRDMVEEYEDSSEETSQCVILPNEHICTLPVNLEYEFSILRATFSPKGDALQMMVLLENEEHDIFDIMYEEIPVNSDSFDNFVYKAYAAGMHDVVDFNSAMLKKVKGFTSLKLADNQVRVDWDDAKIYSIPACSATTQRRKWLKKDVDFCMKFYKEAV